MSFRVKWRTGCAQCDEDILEGQEAEYNFDNEIQHVVCPESMGAGGKPRQVCPLCFCEIPPIGRCDCRD